jgi:hypothetical protein
MGQISTLLQPILLRIPPHLGIAMATFLVAGPVQVLCLILPRNFFFHAARYMLGLDSRFAPWPGARRILASTIGRFSHSFIELPALLGAERALQCARPGPQRRPLIAARCNRFLRFTRALRR